MVATAANATKAFAAVLPGKSVHGLHALDAALVEADGTTNFATLGANVCAAASAALALAASRSLRRPLFYEMSSIFHSDRGRPAKFHTPVPMVTLFGAEPKVFGKTRLREICVAPALGTPTATALQQIASVVAEAVHKLADDANCPSTNPDGSLRFNAYDTVQQAVELAEDCIREAKLQPGVDMFVGIVADGAWCFKESQKYALADAMGEVNGAQLAEVYANLCREKKSLCYLEDTHQENDKVEMRRLMARVGQQVAVAGNNVYAANPAAIAAGAAEQLSNHLVVRLNDAGTISNALDGARTFVRGYKGAGLAVAGEAVEQKGAFLAQLATGIGARYFRCGGLLRAAGVEAYNELATIDAHLSEQGIRVDPPPLPADIVVPPPPSEPVPEVNVKDNKKKK